MLVIPEQLLLPRSSRRELSRIHSTLIRSMDPKHAPVRRGVTSKRNPLAASTSPIPTPTRDVHPRPSSSTSLALHSWSGRCRAGRAMCGRFLRARESVTFRSHPRLSVMHLLVVSGRRGRSGRRRVSCSPGRERSESCQPRRLVQHIFDEARHLARRWRRIQGRRLCCHPLYPRRARPVMPPC